MVVCPGGWQGYKRTKTGPLAELLAVGDLDEGDLVLGAEGNDELLVGLLLAVLVENAHVGLAAVEGLGSLAETAGKTVVDESQLQDTLEGVENRHLALRGIARDLNLVGDLDLGSVVFYVRLWMGSAIWPRLNKWDMSKIGQVPPRVESQISRKTRRFHPTISHALSHLAVVSWQHSRGRICARKKDVGHAEAGIRRRFDF